jgi:hypothetical protein
MVSAALMKLPALAQYHQLLGKALVVVSAVLFVMAVLAIVYRLLRSRTTAVKD